MKKGKLWHPTANRPLVMKVDFDNTIVHEHFPDIGPIIQHTRPTKVGPAWKITSKEVLQKAHSRGAIIIGCTCRWGERLDEAIAFCQAQGIPIDFWNENYPPLIEQFGECRKIFGDVDIDDKNLMPWDWFDVNAWVERNTTWVME
jgi:hypothetical protein